MSEKAIIFNEPHLEFRYGQHVADPRDGLTLFGPFDADRPGKPVGPSYVAIGTDSGIKDLTQWSKALNRPAIESPNSDERLWTAFPGFEAAFGSEWPTTPVRTFALDEERLIQASRQREPHSRCYETVNLYLDAFRKSGKLDENVGVVVCVVPDEVWRNCRPESTVSHSLGDGLSKSVIRSRKAGQLELFSDFNPDQYRLSNDFRRQLKARSMEFGIPLQILRQSTLRLSTEAQSGQRALTPLSNRMWNIATALYYKCGGKPWRLDSARDGVCYIGIAFRRADTADQGTTACCAAQMFLDSGDGVVFLGEYGPWYSPQTRQFHLGASAAHDLLAGVLKTYSELGGKELSEIFLHSHSEISDEEFEGYRKACPEGVALVGVRVREDYWPRLFRVGQMPVLRGTFWKLSERSGLLWGTGFKPRLGTYDGWETPVPLRINIQHGESDIEKVARDILGLTKLNYNACRLGDSLPVTIKFSNAVGEILVSNPTITSRRPQFKFYI
jgi:hypothetical protein